MSDRPIQVGDLVIVVGLGVCCPSNGSIGQIFRVGDFYTGPFDCGTCNKEYQGTLARRVGDNDGWQPDQLKRIPPLDELDGVSEERELPRSPTWLPDQCAISATNASSSASRFCSTKTQKQTTQAMSSLRRGR